MNKPNCQSEAYFTNENTTDILFSRILRQKSERVVDWITSEISDILQRLDLSAAYKAIFQILWYSSLPCFDIRNITAYSNGASSLLQYCEWKGMPISCSAIFTTFPTDQVSITSTFC